MVIGITQQAGFMEYDEYIKLRQMDPGRAELEKNRRMRDAQKARVSEQIEEARNEYKENMEDDPDRKVIYLRNFREKIVSIPMIQEFEEFKDIYTTVRNQLDGLDVIESQLEDVQNGIDSPIGQPGQDDLWSDTPDIQTVEDPDVAQTRMESENAEAITERTEMPEEVAPETESVEDVQKAYKKATGKDAPVRYKNDIEWMKSKM